MFDLNKQWIELPCPRCTYTDWVQMIEVKCQSTVYCHNCKVSIELIDSEASVHGSMKKVNESINKLNNLLNNFGK